MKIELPEQISAWLREYQAQASEKDLSDFVAESIIHDLQGSRAFLTQMERLGQPSEWFTVRPIEETFEWVALEGPVKVADLTSDQLQEIINAYHAFSEWLALHAQDLETVLEERTGEQG